MRWLDVLVCAAGLSLLLGGAECLVRGARSIASRFGMSPVVIGLTVVALGSSAPEVAVSVHATLTGSPDVALGNVVGSNIFNVLFALGAAAVITPLVVARKLIRHDTPIMVGASVLLFVVAFDGLLSRGDAVLLGAALVGYVTFNVRRARAAMDPIAAAHDSDKTKSSALLVIVGIATLVVGSRLLVGGATGIARAFGLSELIIGLTVIAIGTGLPEAVTSIVAALRGEREMAVANVIGSNVLNILCVLAVSAALSADGVAVAPAALRLDLPVMIAAALVCLPVFFGGTISRAEGVLLLAYYAVYVAYMVLDTTGHDAVKPFSAVVLAFVLPLSAIAVCLPLVIRTVASARSRLLRSPPGA